MADNRIWLQIKNHPETRIFLGKELATDWTCTPDLSAKLEEWLNQTLYHTDAFLAEDIEVITENNPAYVPSKPS